MSLKHSFSSISTYDQCPRKFYELYVERKFKDSSPALEEGNRVHKALEDYLNGVGPYPDRAPQDELLRKLKSIDAKAEQALGIRADGSPCGFFDNDVYFRGKLDVVFTTPRHANAIDWKTGKVRENALQAKAYALLLSAVHPSLAPRITFDYLEKGRTPTYKPTRSEAQEIMHRCKIVDNTERFDPRPGPLCGWCAVTTCEHNPGRVK